MKILYRFESFLAGDLTAMEKSAARENFEMITENTFLGRNFEGSCTSLKWLRTFFLRSIVKIYVYLATG